MEELSNEEDKYLTRVLYNNLGNTYLSDGDFYNAEKYYKKSLEKDNNYIYAILGLANIDIYNYQYSKNNNYYGEAEKNPNFYSIYYNKSHLLLNKGRIDKNKKSYYEEAIELIEKALVCLNNKKIEDEEEIFKNLNNTLNSEKTIDNPKVEKVKEKENKIYETSNKEKEILELQKKYNSIINDNKNIIESIDTINLVSDKSDKKTNNINNIISSLNIKNAIIYNAILEPKRLNYRRIKKS